MSSISSDRGGGRQEIRGNLDVGVFDAEKFIEKAFVGQLGAHGSDHVELTVENDDGIDGTWS